MCDEATDQSLDSLHVDALLKARQRAGNEGLSTTVRIFERNDYYYFFERDGELAAEKEGVYTFSNRPPVLWRMDEADFIWAGELGGWGRERERERKSERKRIPKIFMDRIPRIRVN
jgi:hypothetical protein